MSIGIEWFNGLVCNAREACQATLSNGSMIVSANVKQNGQTMITTLLKRRFGTGAAEARAAEVAFLAAACLFPALVVFWLVKMQLTTWQLLVSMVATASLGFQLLVLSFLCRILRRKNDAT